MKLKELKRTVNVSWSPADVHPPLLATGTAAQQVDASFSSSSQLELYSLNLNDPSYDMELKSSLPSPHKFQKIVWSGAGVLVGGCDGGLLNFYNVDRLMKGSTDALVGSSTKHNGHVSALDVNPFQSNLLSSGASDSEIYIWDLNNTSSPMAPGNKSQPSDHVQDLAWNQQVQHILASTFATRCVVWDLRKNEPIMKLSDAQSRTRWRSVAWHPSVATQLCVASEDDQVPVIQLWDLRLAASPLVTLERHQKGVMALSWCRQDPDLLLSASKDGTVLCWNPNNTTPGGELLSEISSEGQWVFDVAWCPRNPCLVASASFDGHVNVHSLNGGTKPNVFNSRSNIMDSFPGVDSMSQMPVVSQQISEYKVQQLLPRPPRWAKRPVRAKFAFGGKLVSFENSWSEARPRRLVHISQVVSEPEIVERATQLDAVLGAHATQGPDAKYRLAEYCRQRGDSATDQNERYTWFFLKANFEPNFRSEVLNLLGFKQDEITSKFKGLGLSAAEYVPDSIDSLTSGIAGLSRGESTETEAELSTDTSTDLSDVNTLIERKLINTEFLTTAKNITIPTGDDLTGLICRALVSGNLEEAVELCLEAKRVADALIIASLGSQELLYRVQKYYLSSTSSDPVSVLSRTLLLSKWASFIGDISLKSWREALATIVTHCDAETLAANCELLGSRLSKEADSSLMNAATLCYLCSASVDVLVSLWQRQYNVGQRGDLATLAQLVELALLARKAAVLRQRPIQVGGKLESVLTEYAMRIASQGHLESALSVLEGVAHTELRERLQCALLLTQPPRPRAQQHHPQQQANTWSSYNNRTRTNSGQHTQRKGSHASAQNDIYSTVAPPVVNQPWASQQAPAPGPLQPALNPPGPPGPPTQPTQPPRPGSVGPHSGGVTNRAKYLVDPSVKSGPAYGQYNYNSVPSQPMLNQGYSFNSGPLPANFSAASVPNPGVNSPNPGVMNPSYQAINPVPVNQGKSNGGYYNPNQFAPEPTPVAPPTAAPINPAAPGWNDPPMPSSALKNEMSALHAGTRQWSQIIEHRIHPDEPKTEVAAPAPITHPLFGVEPQHIPLSPAQTGYPGQQQQQQQQQGYAGAQQAYPGPPQGYPGAQQGYPGAGVQQGYGATPGYPSEQQQYASQMSPGGYQPVEVAAPAAPEPPPKQPLPEEHLHMQTVFDALRAACSLQAHNPQMKRKLDDVQKRLETLYDLLREHRLSENALSVLHTAVQQVQNGDYENALSGLTSLAVGPDFASVASFLPGVKVLLQVAVQAQVYLR